jgi:putative redox protein
MTNATVAVEQISSTASRGNARGLHVIMDRPETKGGTNEGMMGGEAVLNGLGGCFMSNLLAAAKARGIELNNAHAKIEADIADAPARFTAIRMSVSA